MDGPQVTERHKPARLLTRAFFRRPPDKVAPDLLGKILVHELNGIRLSGRIIETEAYLGLVAPASYAYTGESAANTVLFGPPGFAHVYLVYGINYCLSISAHLKGEAGGVLIRAVIPMEGLDMMAKLRGVPANHNRRWLTGGPGRNLQGIRYRAVDAQWERCHHASVRPANPRRRLSMRVDCHHQE